MNNAMNDNTTSTAMAAPPTIANTLPMLNKLQHPNPVTQQISSSLEIQQAAVGRWLAGHVNDNLNATQHADGEKTTTQTDILRPDTGTIDDTAVSSPMNAELLAANLRRRRKRLAGALATRTPAAKSTDAPFTLTRLSRAPHLRQHHHSELETAVLPLRCRACSLISPPSRAHSPSKTTPRRHEPT